MKRVQPSFFRTCGSVPFTAEAQSFVSAVGPLRYTRLPMVSCVPGKRMSGLSGAVSFCALAMNCFGSSGGGAEVGSKDGAGVVAPGMSELAGSWDGWFVA